MQSKIFTNNIFVKISITINATIFTSIIRTDIYTRKATTFRSLTLIFFNIEFKIANTFKSFFVNTFRMLYSKVFKINFFGTSINIKSVFLRYIRKFSDNFFYLIFRRANNSKRCNISLGVPINI